MSESQESSKEAFQRKCSILISLIALMLLINNLGSQNSGSSAAFLNATAINTYSFYQAKTVRQNDFSLPFSICSCDCGNVLELGWFFSDPENSSAQLI
jgi:hypothetical protein